jgi:2-amino-4-hydroxy-6-hydroxymethyldihydropteridine diphosphokinase
MAIEVETEFKPKELLKVLKNIEREIGREESLRWGPRKVDLDILLFDTIILTEDSLEIPHPLMHERDFVLKPLCEIASDIHHPLLKASIFDLLQQIYKKSQQTI